MTTIRFFVSPNGKLLLDKEGHLPAINGLNSKDLEIDLSDTQTSDISAVYVDTIDPRLIEVDYRWLLTSAAPEIASLDRYIAKALSYNHYVRRELYHELSGQEMRFPSYSRHHKVDSVGNSYFPRKEPVVLVLITNSKNQVLLVNNQNWDTHLRSLVSGFVELGESLEDAAEREIQEETGLAIEGISYFGSAPWPYPNLITVGFTARAVEPFTLVLQQSEIRSADWFSVEEVDAIAHGRSSLALPSETSISRRLINEWSALL